MRIIDPLTLCRVECMVCKVASEWMTYEVSKPYANQWGWATCTDCDQRIDPKHPGAPPVLPFDRPS